MPRTSPVRALAVLLATAPLWLAAPGPAADEAATASAPEDADARGSWQQRFGKLLDNDWYKISADIRARIGLADIEGNRNSYAYTVRTRLGIGTKPWHGLSAFVEGEGTVTPAESKYHDGTGDNNNNRSVISDPRVVKLNRAFVRYHDADLMGADVIGGRQRIILDDARFIGNVGWRQNEQTFDAAWASTDLGVEGLRAAYSYLWHINRLWSDQGNRSTRDWDSRSHLMHLSYEAFPWLKMAVFGYILDFRNDSSENSSASYGVRVTGSQTFERVWKVGYSASFAHQQEAANNRTHYEVPYGWVEVSAGHVDWLTVAMGFENLGSDDGKGRFRTPLSTAHKFNGFADAFLDNGGDDGLRDYFLWISPRLPWEINAKAIYHRFWSAERGQHLGDEFDLVATRKFGDHWLALVKAAVFDGQKDSGRADRWRLTFEMNFKY